MLNFLESIVHEDLGRGDLFTQILESYRQDYIANQQLLGVESFDKTTQAYIIAKQYGIFSGEVYAKKICSLYIFHFFFYQILYVVFLLIFFHHLKDK